MRIGALLLAAFTAGCAAASADLFALDEARRVDEEAVTAREGDIDGASHAGQWVVVQRGEIVGAASLPDDAVRAADRIGPAAPHRFVFRPADRGPRLYRLAYLAQGGVVVGRKFLADLGLAAVGGGATGRPSLLRKNGGGPAVDLSKSTRLALEIASLDGAARRTVEAAVDADFDGGLLVPRDLASALALERFEIPGESEVQVTLGRPFRARRATVVVKIPAIEVAGAAEAVYEVSPARK